MTIASGAVALYPATPDLRLRLPYWPIGVAVRFYSQAEIERTFLYDRSPARAEERGIGWKVSALKHCCSFHYGSLPVKFIASFIIAEAGR